MDIRERGRERRAWPHEPRMPGFNSSLSQAVCGNGDDPALPPRGSPYSLYSIQNCPHQGHPVSLAQSATEQGPQETVESQPRSPSLLPAWQQFMLLAWVRAGNTLTLTHITEQLSQVKVPIQAAFSSHRLQAELSSTGPVPASRAKAGGHPQGQREVSMDIPLGCKRQGWRR